MARLARTVHLSTSRTLLLSTSRTLLALSLLGCGGSVDGGSHADAGKPGSVADAASGDGDGDSTNDDGDVASDDAGTTNRDSGTTNRDGGTTNRDAGTGTGEGDAIVDPLDPDGGIIPSGLPFSATFDSNEEYFNNFQIEILHGTGPVTAQEPSTREWPGDHNASCGAPTTTRTLHIDQPTKELMYWCPNVGADSGHIHTSMRTTGFAHVSFAPNRAFNNVHKICWDVSLANLGGRRFPQLAVVPEATYQKNGGVLAYVSGDNAIGTTAAHFIEGTTFLVEMLRGSTVVYVGSAKGDPNYAGFFNGTDKLRRFKHCVTDNENGTVTFALERASSTETRSLSGSIPNGAVRVIFSDYNYNPPKDAPDTPDPNTMHWDNIRIE